MNWKMIEIGEMFETNISFLDPVCWMPGEIFGYKTAKKIHKTYFLYLVFISSMYYFVLCIIRPSKKRLKKLTSKFSRPSVQ